MRPIIIAVMAGGLLALASPAATAQPTTVPSGAHDPVSKLLGPLTGGLNGGAHAADDLAHSVDD